MSNNKVWAEENGYNGRYKSMEYYLEQFNGYYNKCKTELLEENGCTSDEDVINYVLDNIQGADKIVGYYIWYYNDIIYALKIWEENLEYTDHKTEQDAEITEILRLLQPKSKENSYE